MENLGAFVLLSFVFVRLGFPYWRGIDKSGYCMNFEVKEKTFDFGFNYELFSYGGRKIYLESGVW